MFAASLRANVTIISRYTSDSPSGHTYSHRIVRIKGSELRLDTGPETEQFVTIYDLGAGTEIVWDPKHKHGEIHDLLKQSAAAQHQVPTDGLRISIQSTGTQKVLLDRKCREYAFDLGARATFQGSTSYERLAGTMCISEESPESNEVAAFIELARKRGIVFGAQDPNATDARLRTELYFYQSAVRGLVLARNERIELAVRNGSSASAQWTLEVESIDTGPIPNELFVIPPDWKAKKGGSTPGRVPIRWNFGRRESDAHLVIDQRNDGSARAQMED
jgi:hypothetical protein